MIVKASNLALAVYRVTELFPGGEVLIRQMRRVANQIVADLIAGRQKEAAIGVNVLLHYIKIAQAQSWTKEINFVILNKEYEELLSEMGRDKKKKKEKKKVNLPKTSAKKRKKRKLSRREREILKQTQEADKVYTKDIIKHFPDLNRRTLSRDLKYLCSKGYLKRVGRGRNLYYKNTILNET